MTRTRNCSRLGDQRTEHGIQLKTSRYLHNQHEKTKAQEQGNDLLQLDLKQVHTLCILGKGPSSPEPGPFGRFIYSVQLNTTEREPGMEH